VVRAVKEQIVLMCQFFIQSNQISIEVWFFCFIDNQRRQLAFAKLLNAVHVRVIPKRPRVSGGVNSIIKGAAGHGWVGLDFKKKRQHHPWLIGKFLYQANEWWLARLIDFTTRIRRVDALFWHGMTGDG